jgi:hypothetical protein
MRDEGVFRRLSGWGATAQSTVPGLYAWGVTVAPAAWARGAPALARIAALVAVLALIGGAAGERLGRGRARTPCLWAFVLASALTWSASPASLAPQRIDASRAIAGMIGWALFAFATAAPVPKGGRDEERRVEHGELRSRAGRKRGDSIYVTGGAVLAATLQLIGWRAAGAERALLVRLVALAAGLAVIGASAEIAVARHSPRIGRSPRGKLRGAMAALVALVLLGVTGILFALRG